MKKKLLSVMLVLCMVFTLLPIGGIRADEAGSKNANSGTCGYDATWTLDDEGTLTIEGTGYVMTDGGKGYDVDLTLWNKDRVKKVVVKEGITEISSRVFTNCKFLASVTLADSVKYVASDAFDGTQFYNTEENWTDGILYIGNVLVTVKSDLAGDVKVKDGVKVIPYAAFSGKSITSITLPESVEELGYRVFSGCKELKSVVIPNGVTLVPGYAFYGCTSLESVTLPESVEKIDNNAFYGCTALATVTIPNSVKAISGRAFYGCSALTTVTIPNSVESMEYEAFRNCSALTSITLPDSMKSVGVNVFANTGYSSAEENWENGFLYCGKWLLAAEAKMEGKVTIKDGTTMILGGAFSNAAITSVTIPDGVVFLGNEAFFYCTQLTSVALPDSVATMGTFVFNECTLLENVKLSSALETIPAYTFQGCTSLKSITIPDKVTRIENRAFYGCSALAEVTLGKGLEWVDGFENCTALTSIVIPEGVKRVAGFNGCTALTSVTLPKSLKAIDSNAFDGCVKLADITIPDGVETIASRAFANCTALTKVIIPDSVLSFNSYVFQNCTALTSVTLPENLEYIGGGAFEGCTALTAITLPKKLEKILYDTFYGCEKLAAITIPESVVSIASGAFSGTAYAENEANWEGGLLYIGDWLVAVNSDQIRELAIASGNTVKFKRPVYSSEYSTEGGSEEFSEVEVPALDIVIKDGTRGLARNIFYYCYNVASITIPDSVAYIGDDPVRGTVFCENPNNWENGLLYAGKWLLAADRYADYGEGVPKDVVIKDGTKGMADSAMYYCYSMESLKIPSSMTAIPDGAFSSCYSLKTVTISEGVTSIGDNAFAFAPIESIKLPESLTNIGDYTFQGLKLKSVEIPKNVKSIGVGAFADISTLESATLPAGMTEIPDSMFYQSASLKSITIPDSVKKIGENAFFYCTKLGAVTLGSGVTSIGDSAFSQCSELESITIPASVTEIGEFAFHFCGSLKEVNIANGVKSIGYGAFAECDKLLAITIPKSVETIGEYALGFKDIDSYSASSDFTIKNTGLTIKCYAGSAAETYAKANEVAYTLIDVNKDTKDEIEKAEAGTTVTVEATNDDKISAEVLEAAKDKGVSLEIKSDAGSEVVWKFDKVTNAVEFNPQVTVDVEVPAISEVLEAAEGEAAIPETTKVTTVSFEHEGDLPGEAKIELPLPTDTYAEGSTVYLYYFDSAKKLFEKISSATCTNGKALFTMTHCSDYIITNEELPEALIVKGEPEEDENTPVHPATTGDVNSMIWLAFMMLGVMMAGAVVLKKRNTEF